MNGIAVGENTDDISGCFELSNPITVVRNYNDGGELTFEDGSTEQTICAGDGIPDPLDISLMGNAGDNMAYVITDDMNNILALPPAPPFDLDGAGPGTCLIYNLSYSDDFTGLAVGNNISGFDGCFDLSNPIYVIRQEAEAGDLTFDDGSTEQTICAGDGTPDPLGITLTGESGEGFDWIITDDMNNILALPPAPPFDLEGAGPGTCLIYHLAYAGNVNGIAVGENTDDISGCFELSNPIYVIRESVEPSMIETADGETQLTICADDGISDAFDVVATGGSGEFNQWIITNDMGYILGLPAAPPFDLEGAGTGLCQIWNLNYNEGIIGLEMNGNIAHLEGCFALSNPINVTRLEGIQCDIFFCDVDGGNIIFTSGTNTATICAGDSIADPLDVLLINETGPNTGWVITDDLGNILALPAAPPFDLNGAGPGVCLIWHISYEDGLQGLEVGMNALNLLGCHNLSNPLTVIRLEGDDCGDLACNVEGGILTFDDGSTMAEICAGDGIPDPLDVILMDASGPFSEWIIADDAGNILALPPAPPFDLDGAGPGVCLIYHVSHNGTITGLHLGGTTNWLGGCFELSNPIYVTRLEGDDCDALCNVDGGSLTFGDGTTMTEICAGDNMPDPLDVVLTGQIGAESTFVITNDVGNILAVISSPPFDLDLAGPGLCSIYHLSYSGMISGLNSGSNINDVSGCFDLSNPITVERFSGTDCDMLIDYDEPVAFTVYPNPTTDMLYVTLENLTAEEGTAIILDPSGRQMMERIGEEGDTLEINMSNFSNGVYFVRVISGFSSKIKRIIKIQ